MPDELMRPNPTAVAWKLRPARGQPASAAKNATTSPSAAVCSTVSWRSSAATLSSHEWPSTGPARTIAPA